MIIKTLFSLSVSGGVLLFLLYWDANRAVQFYKAEAAKHKDKITQLTDEYYGATQLLLSEQQQRLKITERLRACGKDGL